MTLKVCHVTSVHNKEDIRIFQKECVSLAAAGYDTYLVQRGEDYEKQGVHVIGFGQPAKNRIDRILHTARKAYKKAAAVDADIYHLHDPELLPYGLKLKKAGHKVIFDSHEDVPADIREKEWIPSFLRKLMSRCYTRYEARCLKQYDGVISVTPHLVDRLRQYNSNTVMIANYPLFEIRTLPSFTQRKVAFPGLLSAMWYLDNLIDAVSQIDGAVLELRSGNVDKKYMDYLKQQPGWAKCVNFPGAVSYQGVLDLLEQCSVGAALCRPGRKFGGIKGTLGVTKIFEYMMAGLPVVCTNFTLWEQIMDKYQCGICVDPSDVSAIKEAIEKILNDPALARQMGRNGQKAVAEEFNWSAEEKKLLAMYKKISEEGE